MTILELLNVPVIPKLEESVELLHKIVIGLNKKVEVSVGELRNDKNKNLLREFIKITVCV